MDAHVRDLRYFLAVADAASFTAAAERLYVSQPALSKQVRALEKSLGQTLLCRDNRGICLTPAGAVFLPHAREVVDRWDKAWNALAQQANSVVVGLQTSPGRNLLPRIRAELPEQLTLELRQVSWADASCGLADRSTEAAFCWLPLPDPSAYRWLTLARERRVLAVADKHPLAGRESVTFAEIAGEPMLALPESAGPLRDHFLAVDQRGGVPPVIGGVVTDGETTYEAVAAGQGVVLLAEGNTPVLARPCVRIVAVEDLPPSELVLAWRADTESAAVRRLVQACVDAGLDQLG
ncbi:LysR family transcriptional regulator [Kribbella lupini]|uniref:LysR family transcriptional regulator n=1 Tax=Kribbella lupini TaxID=291602 RepID=A0ABN2B936_9ACTN